MPKLSFTRQLLEFNRRVLDQGTVDINSIHLYSMNDIKRFLFFNRVFLSNMDEMFSKYNMNGYIEEYVDMIKIYNSNIDKIIYCMAKNATVTIESDLESVFETRLLAYRTFSDQEITKGYDIASFRNLYRDFDLQDGMLYYITLFNDKIFISYIDPNRSAYSEILSYTENNCDVYVKNDQMICDYINRKICGFTNDSNTTIIRVTKKCNITKMEYDYMDNDTMNVFRSIFGKSLCMINNQYLYTDDIMRIIDSKIPPVSVIKQRRIPIILDSIFRNDLLIEYPKDSFYQFLDLLNTAAEDNTVKSIYITLYRIGNDPDIYYILKRAVDNGKDVNVNIELNASGEDINKVWIHEMEEAGINVFTYNTKNVNKVHAKLTLIEFINGDYITQIGTGNYHTKTTSQYTDLSLITSDETICSMIRKVFSILCGEVSYTYPFVDDLLVSRYNLRPELIRLINIEASKGSKGYISFKCNSLDDDDVIRCLDIAARNNCKIDLIVRGVCTWIPEQLGSNVTIKSIVWDKLEHSRVYCFGSVNPTIYIGSLDLVTNKMDNRIETLVKIKDPDIIIRICNYMRKYITNTNDSWIQTSSGIYMKER